MDINIVEAIDRVIKDSRKDDDSCIGKSDVEVLRELLNQVSPDEAANWRETVKDDQLWLSYVYVTSLSDSEIQSVMPEYTII